MSEQQLAPRGREEEEAVRHLLEAAGPRPTLAAEDLAAVRAAARTAWEASRRTEAPTGAAVRQPWSRRLGGRGRIAALAAALALAVALAGWWATGRSSAPPTRLWGRAEVVTGEVLVAGPGAAGARRLAAGDAVLAGSRLETAAGASAGQVALRLVGGAEVRLDSASALRRLSADTVELTAGALYVDSHGSHGPTIETPLGTARELGTQFQLRLGGGGSWLSVWVREGKVAVGSGTGSQLVATGRELVLHQDGSHQERAAAGYGIGWAWVLQAAPSFALEGESLVAWLAWVEHETGWRVQFADPRLAAAARSITLHGDVGHLPPDQAVFAVLPTAGLTGRLEGGTLTVRRDR